MTQDDPVAPGATSALLGRARELSIRESGLAVAVTQRRDGSPVVSVVNAGVIHHPVTGELVVGFVARGGARKLANLRARPHATIAFRSGWEWIAVEGDVELAGPDDPLEGVDDISNVLRTVYAAAVGGSQEDWRDLDDKMAAERHTAVLISPVRVYSNPPAAPGSG